MTPTPRLLAFAGRLREGSYNRRGIPVLAGGARTAGAEVTRTALRGRAAVQGVGSAVPRLTAARLAVPA